MLWFLVYLIKTEQLYTFDEHSKHFNIMAKISDDRECWYHKLTFFYNSIGTKLVIIGIFVNIYGEQFLQLYED